MPHTPTDAPALREAPNGAGNGRMDMAVHAAYVNLYRALPGDDAAKADLINTYFGACSLMFQAARQSGAAGALPKFRTEEDDEESATFFVNDQEVGRVNYDEHGSEGMRMAKRLFAATCAALAAPSKADVPAVRKTSE